MPSYRAIVENFAYWDDIEIHVRGTVHRIGGNGFCGCSRRSLLMLLHDRARALGIELLFNQEATPEDFPDADLIVAADGINSTIRTRSEAHFQPRTDLRPNRFAWMGSTRPFDAFTFFFKERPEGIFIAHCYQYEPGASTWVLEMEPETFARAGLAHATEAESARFMEHVFAEELDGHKLITNRSLWRQFPMIRCARWTQGNVVLLGDAKATAHFSIGSGTKLAMEDAIALHAAVMAGGSVADCLARFEHGRREAVEKIQHAADVSLVWFEHVRRFWPMHPTRFAFGVMTRSKAITYDDLALRAPDFVQRSGCAVRAGGGRQRRTGRGNKAADVPAVSATRYAAGEPGRGLADVPIQRGGRAADGLAHGALRRPGDRRSGADLYRNDLPLGRCPHYAGLHGAVERRTGGRLDADRRVYPCARGGEDVPPAWPCRAERQHAADVGRHGPSAASRADGPSYPPPPFRITRTVRCPAAWTGPIWSGS